MFGHTFIKPILEAWGSRLKFATHRRKSLVTLHNSGGQAAPIVATNGIEERHKEGTVLEISCSVGLLS
jgi:hypothetical protein